ncbi:MAG: hypothetical protein K6A90_04020 [Lachnospiraceae bacterium]|nr:hypothetical protein [Lachnospiraceae bacterium]
MDISGIKKRLSDPVSILFITALFGSILYISLIYNDNLWVDEAFTASLIRGSWPEVIRDTVADTLPPFYNFAGKLLTEIFGYSSLILKLFSCLPMILLIFLGGRRVFNTFGFRTAYFFELFLLSMPYFFHYAVEIRMYSWGMFSCGMAAVFFTEIIDGTDSGSVNRSSWAAFTLFTVFSGYIHHFALIASGMMWLIILIYITVKKETSLFRSFAVSLMLFLILYLPCLFLTVKQIQNASSYFSMSPLSFGTLLSDIRYPFVTHITILSAVLLILAFAAAVYSLLKGLSIKGLMLFSVIYLTLLFGYGVSLAAGKSLFTARYLSPALPVLWLGAAILFDCVITAFNNNRYMITILIALIVITGTVDYRNAYISEYAPGVENMKAFFDENLTPRDGYLIFEDNYEIELCFRYYYPELKKTDWENAGNIQGNLWFFETDGFKKELDKAEKYGYNPIYIGDFSFDRYSFSLYRLEKA